MCKSFVPDTSSFGREYSRSISWIYWSQTRNYFTASFVGMIGSPMLLYTFKYASPHTCKGWPNRLIRMVAFFSHDKIYIKLTINVQSTRLSLTWGGNIPVRRADSRILVDVVLAMVFVYFCRSWRWLILQQYAMAVTVLWLIVENPTVSRIHLDQQGDFNMENFVKSSSTCGFAFYCSSTAPPSHLHHKSGEFFSFSKDHWCSAVHSTGYLRFWV